MEYGKTTQKKDAKRDCLPSGQSLFIICLLFIFRLSSFSRLFVFRLSFFFPLICLSPSLFFPLICLSPLLLFPAYLSFASPSFSRLFVFRLSFFSAYLSFVFPSSPACFLPNYPLPKPFPFPFSHAGFRPLAYCNWNPSPPLERISTLMLQSAKCS